MPVFINFSNHPSALWSEKQLHAAENYGTVIDIEFPDVSAAASALEIGELADQCVVKILDCEPAAVLCQGEFTLAFAVVRRLRSREIRCLAACSHRESRECKNQDGAVVKQSVYVFEQFREYE